MKPTWIPRVIVMSEPGMLLYAVFGSNSSLSLFSWNSVVGGGGGLVCESVSRADLVSDHFYTKKSM